ncbi:MAG: L,D-transpeptidase family protein [Pseudomonadota bacterium]
MCACGADAALLWDEQVVGVTTHQPLGVASPHSSASDAELKSSRRVVPKPALPPQKFVSDTLERGVVIVISTASQKMHVLHDGVLWKTSPVSTGKPGKETPPGVFAILQKKKFHRSNLYNNAPMPFMQRLTWDGIAIHAGALPGYPASHGCIRLPKGFAKELFGLTDFTSTAVIVTNELLADATQAQQLARRTDKPVPIDPVRLKRSATAYAKADVSGLPGPVTRKRVIGRTQSPRGQTIQLIAAGSHREASAFWERISKQKPELTQAHMFIVSATVNSERYYRLRLTASNAHEMCDNLKRAGIDCFRVT